MKTNKDKDIMAITFIATIWLFPIMAVLARIFKGKTFRFWLLDYAQYIITEFGDSKDVDKLIEDIWKEEGK